MTTGHSPLHMQSLKLFLYPHSYFFPGITKTFIIMAVNSRPIQPQLPYEDTESDFDPVTVKIGLPIV